MWDFLRCLVVCFALTFVADKFCAALVEVQRISQQQSQAK